MREIIKKWSNAYSNLPIGVKAVFWFTICNFVQKGIQFITVPIFTRLFSQAEYGQYSLYLSWSQIFGILISLNLYAGVYNKAMDKFSNDRDGFDSASYSLTLFLNLFWLVLYLLFKTTVNRIIGLSTNLILLMFLDVLTSSLIQFWLIRRRFEYSYRKVVIISVLQFLLNPLLGIFLVIISVHKVEARIASIIIVNFFILVSVVDWKHLIERFHFKNNYLYWMYSLKFNIPLLPHYLSSVVLNQGDRIIINKFCGTESVALYSLAYNLGMVLNMVTNSIVQAITPWIYERLTSGRGHQLNDVIDWSLIIASAFGIILTLLAPEALRILAPITYLDAKYAIPPIACSAYFVFVYNLYSNIEFYYERRAFIALGSSIVAIANVVLNLYFVPLYGYIAAAYTTLICYIVYALAHCIFVERTMISEIGTCPLQWKGIFIISAVTIGASLVSPIIYDNIFIRYLLVLIISLGLIIFAIPKIKIIR